MAIDDAAQRLPGREETASRMARRAGAALDGGDDTLFTAELDALCAYLEADVFPLFEARGLTVELEEAERRHRDLRRMCSHLASASPPSRASARHLLGAVARLLARRP